MKAFILFCCLFLSGTFAVFSQALIWEKQIPNYSSDPSVRVEFRDFEPGSSGKIYSTGFYRGHRAPFGNIWAVAEFNIVDPMVAASSNYKGENSFVACQDQNGNFLWAKSLCFNKAGAIFPSFVTSLEFLNTPVLNV